MRNGATAIRNTTMPTKDSPATAGERGGMETHAMVCAICESAAEWIHHDGCYRHEGEPSDARFANQGFCDKYGYPIPVKSAELIWLRAENERLRACVREGDATLRVIAFWLPTIGYEQGDIRYTDVEDIFSLKRLAADAREAIDAARAGLDDL